MRIILQRKIAGAIEIVKISYTVVNKSHCAMFMLDFSPDSRRRPLIRFNTNNTEPPSFMHSIMSFEPLTIECIRTKYGPLSGCAKAIPSSSIGSLHEPITNKPIRDTQNVKLSRSLRMHLLS